MEIIKAKHEPIVSRELWLKVSDKRKKRRGPRKVEDRVNLLTGIVKCPVCGVGMVMVVSRNKNQNHGGMYKPVYGYICRNKGFRGQTVCSFKRQYNQEKINSAVYEIICKMVDLKSFDRFIVNEFDYNEVEKYEAIQKDLRKQIYCKESEKDRLGIRLDNLDVTDELYMENYTKIENRIDAVYDELSELEDRLEEVKQKVALLKNGVIAGENIRKVLGNFKTVYQDMSDYEKKSFYQNLVDKIELYPEKREDRREIKSITFKFPIIDVADKGMLESSTKRAIYKLDCSKLGLTKAESHATYAMIKDFVKEKYGLHVSSLYIAQIKRKYGLDLRKNYNVSKKDSHRVPNCPKEKEKCITAALRHFKEI